MARETWRVMKRPDGTPELVDVRKLDAWLAKYPPQSKKFELKIKSVERGSWVLRDGKLVPKYLAGTRPRQRGDGLQVIKDIEPFQNIAVDNGYIGGRRQRRDMIRAHDLIEVGNEPAVNRKTHGEWSRREFAEDIKTAYRQHGHDVL